MSRTQNLWQDILNRIDSTYYLLRQDTLALGGTSGSGGGSGGRPGGYSGQLAQIHVAGDFTESFLNVSTSGSIGSLLHNLDNARAYLKGTHQFWASSGSPPTDYLNISSGSWHHTSGNAPLRFTGGASPSVQAPESDNRFALLTMNTSGQMQWVYGASAASPSEPTYPSPTSGSLPLWLVYTRSSGSVITQYDRGLASHYIFSDARPILDWGLGGTGTATSGSPPGDWMDNSGDVMNFAPTRVYTVGPNGEFSTITAALAASVGDSPSTSSRHTIWPSPGTYTESFTVGSFQGVVGIGNREVVIDGTVTLNGSVSSIANTRIQPTSGTAIVISGGTPYVFNNSLGPSSGSTISVTSGTAVIRNNSFSGTTGVYYTGGTIQSSENFFNSGCPLVVNGATVFVDDWMDTLDVTSGPATLGARASANSISLSVGSTSSGAYLERDTSTLTVLGRLVVSADSTGQICTAPTSTLTSGTAIGTRSFITANPSSASSANYQGISALAFTASGNGNNFTGVLYGIAMDVRHLGTATASDLRAGAYVVGNTSTGTISSAHGLRIQSAFNTGGGTITSNYGIYIENQTAGSSDYGIYIAGSDTYAIWVDSGLARFDGNGTRVFELPADATDPTSGGGAAAGRIPVLIGGVTKYLAYY